MLLVVSSIVVREVSDSILSGLDDFELDLDDFDDLEFDLEDVDVDK